MSALIRTMREYWHRQPDSVGVFRFALGSYLILYYTRFLVGTPGWRFYFSAHGMVDRALLGDYRYPSLLFLFPSPVFLNFCTAGLFILAVLFALGRLSRPWVMLLFILNLSFLQANPYILHEPQHLANLFLLSFAVFFPVRNGQPADPFLIKTLIIALGIYYFVAGLKKLPDPSWRSGVAVGELIAWADIAKTSWGSFLLSHIVLNRFFSYSTLLFELSFVFVCLSRWRFYWLAVGLAMHVGILLTMDVGTISEIMLVWYFLLLKLPDTSSSAALIA